MNRWQGKRVGVLMGGISKEREVSLRSGKAIASALRRRQYDVVEIDVGFDLVTRLQQTPIAVAMLALHGPYGEDGTIQGLLEFLRIPYTGTGVDGSAVAMNKLLCKRIARDLGIDTAQDQVFHATVDSVDRFMNALTLALPVIVKPVREGSTIGLHVVRELGELPRALQVAAASDDKILIEAFVAGTEITVGVVCGEALPLVEIVPKQGLYDYTAKYTKGMTEYITPARVPEATRVIVTEWTLQLWRELECRGFARADYIVRPDGSAIFLEINTIPGMTETSLVPKAAAQAGISFDDVCEQCLNDAGLKGHGV